MSDVLQNDGPHRPPVYYVQCNNGAGKHGDSGIMSIDGEDKNSSGFERIMLRLIHLTKDVFHNLSQQIKC